MPADPLAALRQPIVGVDPRAEFVAALRARLESSLRPPPDVPTIDLPQRRRQMTTTSDTTSDTKSDAKAAGPTVTSAHPRLSVSGAARAIDFYRQVFGAELVGDRRSSLFVFGELESEPLGHLRVGGRERGVVVPVAATGFQHQEDDEGRGQRQQRPGRDHARDRSTTACFGRR